jgi:hypothetical protein
MTRTTHRASCVPSSIPGVGFRKALLTRGFRSFPSASYGARFWDILMLASNGQESSTTDICVTVTSPACVGVR